MPDLSLLEILLIAIGGTVMFYVLLNAIGQSAMVAVSQDIESRRLAQLQRQQEDRAAEAFGRAAALEPLALNPDGTVEEPIIANVESPVE